MSVSAQPRREPTAPQWTRIEILFDELYRLGIAEREKALLRACEGDAALQRELRSLLAAAEGEDPLLDHPARVLGFRIEDSPAREAGLRLGSWRLLQRIGRGGMGEVYAGERADGSFRRDVAIKLLKRGLDTEQLLSRFLRERGILGRLQHPNIAQLIDAGATPDGHPYFVMERVEGTSIERWCEAHRATVNQILRLMLQVCDAVYEAHRNLVVHRDLKPSNVLVTAEGQVKLLDFGVAKILHEEDAHTTQALTVAPVTPAFAAPEQLLGRVVNTATDVYALGVLLYRLLAGCLPQRRHGLIGAAANLAETQTERPSLAALRADAQLPQDERPRRAKALRGDLDRIVLKALHADAARRYPSAGELGQDLRRYLAHEPILARPDELAYVARKFVRRHWLAVTSTLLLLCAILGGAGAALWQAHLARIETHKAEAVKDFLIDTLSLGGLGSEDPAAARKTTVEELLREATERMPGEFAEQPQTRLELLGLLSGLNRDLERHEDALALARAARSLVLQEKGSDAAFDSASLDVAEALIAADDRAAAAEELEAIRRRLDARDDRESLQRARLLLLQAQIAQFARPHTDDSTRRQVEEALAILDGTHPQSALRILGRYLLSNICTFGGDRVAAVRHAREGLELARARPNGRRWLVAEGVNQLYKANDFEDLKAMIATGREGVSALAEVFGPDHPRAATAEADLGAALHTVGQHEEGRRLMRSALAKLQRQLPADHWWVLDAQLGLGFQLLLEGRVGEAQRLLEAAAPLVARHHPRSVYESTLHARLGHLYTTTGRFDAAEHHVQKAIELARELYGTRRLMVVRASYRRGQLLRERGRLAEAESEIRDVLRAMEPDTSRIAWNFRMVVQLGLAAVLNDAQRWTEAGELAGSVLQGIRTDAERAMVVAQESMALYQLGRARCGGGAVAQGSSELRESIAIFERTDWEHAPLLADARIALTACTGDPDEALRQLALAQVSLSQHAELNPNFLARLHRAQARLERPGLVSAPKP